MTDSAAILPSIAQALAAIEAGDYRSTALDNLVAQNDLERQIIEALRTIQLRNLHFEQVLRQCVIGNYSVQIDHPYANDLIGGLVNEVLGRIRSVVLQANVISCGDYSAEISPQSEKDELGIALFKMTKTLREIAEVSSKIASGDFSQLVRLKGGRDYLAQAMNAMIWSLREMARQANAIAEGNYTMEIGLRSEQDDLGRSIDKMMKVIRSQLVALQESNLGLSEFAHVASHDLNAPLCKIAYSCELIKEACEGKLHGNLFQLFDVILRSCNQMSNLIDDLLAHARMGGSETVFTTIDLNALVADIVSGISHQLSDAGAQVSIGRLPVVLGDQTSLLRLFQNLIGNALKYRGASPLVIEISDCSEEKNWIFSVRDNGIGIDAVNHQRIFDPFVRLHSSTDVSGTGIGLATCSKIVKQLGGKIWVDSALSSGSTFYISFPKSGSEISIAAIAASHRKRILLVDDDKDQLLILAAILEKGDFELETSDSSQAGLQAIKFKHFDLVISDVNMPLMSGAQFLSKLRSQSSVPVLMLTSSGTEREQELLALGANDFCTKKDAYLQLLSKVQSLLGNSNSFIEL